jgi:hypothetical protein
LTRVVTPVILKKETDVHSRIFKHIFLLKVQLLKWELHKEDENFFISVLTQERLCGMIAVA